MNYRLTELIDVEETQRLLQRFFEAGEIPAAIIDLKGQVLVSSRWRRACTDFHRANPLTCKRCIESDTILSNELLEGKLFSLYRCPNGLTDAASPIIIEGQHLANAFIGQFFTEKPDWDFFRRQAREFDFDEVEYLEALAEVPVVQEATLPSTLAFLTSFAELVASLGLRQIRQLETEERLRVTLSSIGDAVITTDMNGRVTFLNPAAEMLTGWKREDAAGLPVRKVFHIINELTGEPAADIVARVLREGTVTALANHTSLITRRGNEIPIEDSAAPIKDGAGNVSGVVLVFHDVTEKRRGQDALRRQAELLRHSFDAVILWQPDGGIESWNRGAEELYGYREDEVLGRATHDLLKTVFPVPWYSVAAMLRESGRWEGELRHTARDGRKLIVSTRLVRIVGEDGWESILETNRDITAQKAIEEERELLIDELRASKEHVEFQAAELEAGTEQLRAARDQLEVRVQERTAELVEANRRLQEQAALIDLAHDAIIVRDLSDSILYWNKGAEILYRHSRQQALGKDIQDLLKTRFPESKQVTDDCLAMVGAWEGELEQTTGEGRLITVESRRALLRDAESIPIAILQIDRDITESKQLETEVRRRRDELVHLDRVATMAELASSLAHELGQPLAGILSNAHAARRFLDRHEPDLEEIGAALADIVDDTQRAGNVIQKLRSMLKKQAAEAAELDINAVVAETLKLVSSDAIRKKVVVQTDLAPGLPLIVADRVQLQQVVINLILNGFDALAKVEPNGRRIVIRTELEGPGFVGVSVSDTGPAVEEEVIGRIFESFFTTKPEGLGMGLSISRTIIESHGGRIWAERNAVHGMTFRFFLPAV